MALDTILVKEITINSDTRDCGGCTVCCTVSRVPEFNKLENQDCVHQIEGKGCGIHTKRPMVCKKYFCEWAKGNAPEDFKPDKVGVMLERVTDDIMSFLIPPNRKTNWYNQKTEDYAQLLKSQGISVVTNTGKVLLAEGHDTEYVWEQIEKQARINRIID